MIDFRYHIVSIVAVFLALAVGIALGSGPLKDPIDAALANQTASLRAEKQALQQQVTTLTSLADNEDSWVRDLSKSALASELVGQRAVIIAVPGAGDTIARAAAQAVTDAGGTVSGTVFIAGAWTDPSQGSVLGPLAQGLALPGEQVDPSADPLEQAAQVLASAVVVNTPRLVGQDSPEAAAVLSGFKQGGFLSFTGTPSQRASIAVVVSGPPPSQTSDAIDAANTGLLAIANELDRQGRGAVVAGPEGSALPGGLVGALRNSAVKNAVSSDDIADTASGMASVVVALHQQVGQQTGQYGTGPGADSFAPVLTSPAP